MTIASRNISLDFGVTPVFHWNLNATADIVINQGGTWSSKNWSIAQVLIVIAITTKLDKPITVVGRTLPNLKRGALRDFEDIINNSKLFQSKIKKFNKTDKVYTFDNGSKIEFFSVEDYQKAKDGKRAYLYINEANGIPYSVAKQLINRTSKRVFIDFNPDIKFWAHTEYHENSDFDTELFISNCFDHNQFTPEKMKRLILADCAKDSNYKRVYGYGLTGKVKGLVFPKCYSHTAMQRPLKKHAYGLDFGFTNDPSVLVECGLSRGEFWGECLLYETGMTNKDLSQVFDANGLTKQDEIYADSASPKDIQELKNYGWNVIGAKKGQGSINASINKLKEYTLNVVGADWVDESNRYKWKVHSKDGTKLNIPIDKHNHCWDAARYYAMGKLMGEKPSNGTLYVPTVY